MYQDIKDFLSVPSGGLCNFHLTAQFVQIRPSYLSSLPLKRTRAGEQMYSITFKVVLSEQNCMCVHSEHLDMS